MIFFIIFFSSLNKNIASYYDFPYLSECFKPFKKIAWIIKEEFSLKSLIEKGNITDTKASEINEAIAAPEAPNKGMKIKFKIIFATAAKA